MFAFREDTFISTCVEEEGQTLCRVHSFSALTKFVLVVLLAGSKNRVRENVVILLWGLQGCSKQRKYRERLIFFIGARISVFWV